MLSAMHIGSHSLIFKDFKFVSEKTAEKCWSRCFPEERDILVVSRGAGVGRTIISKCRGYCLMGSVLLFKPASQVNERFLSNFLNSPIGNEKLRTTSGASAQQAIYIAHLKRDYVVPLPPLAEQARIVAKVEELMRLCDRMETQLTTTQTESRRLLEAVLHEAITLHTGER
jgi:type I restriction enzyme S subunit